MFAMVKLVLEQDGGLENLVGLFRTLTEAAVEPAPAKRVVETLLAEGRSPCEVPDFMDLVWMEAALRVHGVRMSMASPPCAAQRE